MRTVELHGNDPARWGEQHGEALRADIRALYALRLHLMLADSDLGTEANVLELARHHLPLLLRFDQALYDELCGIARGALCTPEELVVLNHYTDLRDLRQRDLAKLEAQHEPGGCSAVCVHPATGRLLGQTWDMHASAEPYVVLLKIPVSPDLDTVMPADGRGFTIVFSIAGCLGMTGLAPWGTALTVNSMNALDATVGVVWPAVVRKALRQPTAARMLALVEATPIGSGRHYVLADREEMFALEATGTKRRVVRTNGTEPYFHTNHCIDRELSPLSKVYPGGTTLARYATLERCLGATVPADGPALFSLLAQVTLLPNPARPHDLATCGAIVMDIDKGTVHACTGPPTRWPLALHTRA